MPTTPRDSDRLIQALLRWEESGGVWRVAELNSSTATVALLRCDAGEEVDRISSDDPAWLSYLSSRPASDA